MIIKDFVYKIRGLTPLNKLIKRGLIIGDNCNIMHNVNIDDSHCWLIEIGNNVTIAPNVHILAHDASTKLFTGYTKIGNVKIGNNVFIGAGTIILPNTIIGDNVIVGAGSVITKKLESDSVYAGNPCKKICTLEEYINKNKSNMNDDNTFDITYTLNEKISNNKKAIMKNKLNNKIGYIP